MKPLRRPLAVLASVAAAVTSTMVALAAHAAMLEYRPTENGCRVAFYAHSTGHDFTGATSKIVGSFGADRERVAETAHGEIRIPVRLLKTGIAARDKKMYEVMAADRFPAIIFRLSRLDGVRWTGADTFTATMNGSLSIHGVPREVSLPVVAAMRGGDVAVTGEVRLKMTDYGIDPPGFLFLRVADEVRIAFTMVGRAA